MTFAHSPDGEVLVAHLSHQRIEVCLGLIGGIDTDKTIHWLLFCKYKKKSRRSHWNDGTFRPFQITLLPLAAKSRRFRREGARIHGLQRAIYRPRACGYKTATADCAWQNPFSPLVCTEAYAKSQDKAVWQSCGARRGAMFCRRVCASCGRG